MTRWQGLLLACAVALTAACSMVQLGYGQLDRILYWYVDDYLPLSPEQGTALRPRIARLVQWHCTTQLPSYVAWLRAVEADLVAAAPPERLDRHVDEVIGYLRAIGAALAPDATTLLAQATPQQIAALFEAMDKRSREYREEWVEPPPEELARKREKRMRSRIEDWIGPLNAPQEQALARWSAGFEPTGPSFLDSRLRWQAGLRHALENRADAHLFAQRIHGLFVQPELHWNPEYLRLAQANRRRTLELLAAVAAALDDTQRRRLDWEVRSVSGDLQKLACAAPPALGGLPSATGSFLADAGAFK